MGLSHLIQRSITKKLLPSKPSNIISSSWFLADTTAKSFDLSGGSNGAKINSFDGNDRLKISKSSYHVSSGGFTRGVVFWEPNMPVTIEEFQMPRRKAGEVLIKTKACGVCHSDLHVIKGEIPFPSLVFPVGSRVAGAFIMPCGNCFYCSKFLFFLERPHASIYYCLYDSIEIPFNCYFIRKPISMYSMGGLAEYCVVPAHGLTILPNSLPYSVFTAYGAMAHAAQVRPGDSVAVIGVGGVGSSCLQIARAFGASDIIAVDVQDEKLEKAKTFGATATINSKIEDPIEMIKEITGGRGVDIAVEALGKPLTFSQCTQSVRDGGKAVMIGIAQAGAIGEIDINRLVRRKYQSLQTRESSEVWCFNKALGIAEIEDFQLVKNLSKKIENKKKIQ
ncbi:alcohol dehydrogenase class [Salix suchowensis]|nr:alcohol dehydrogenase class [Salix suchowensis]